MDVLRVGVTPWAHMNPKCLPQWKTGCQPGVELDLLHTIATMSNLRLSIVIANGTGCGKTPTEEGSNGTWTGLLKMLRDRKIDVIGNLCDVKKLSHIKQDFFTASSPVWQYSDQFVIQTPTPPPLAFAPFAPFSRSVWLAYFITYIAYLTFVTFYYYYHFGASSIEKVLGHFIRAETVLRDSCFGFLQHVPMKLIWPFWLLLLTLMIMFYNTYILSAVLHPFPVWQPFANVHELTAALRSGEYRLLSHKTPPPTPGECMDKPCEKDFQAAVKKGGFDLIRNASGCDLLSAVAEQDPNADSKLVLVQGSPFISLYLSEFRKERGRLWIIDDNGGAEKMSAFVWHKELKKGQQLNFHLGNICDYKLKALSRYLRLFGTQPHTGEKISELAHQQAIGLNRFRELFFAHFGGMLVAGLIFVIEIECARRQRRYLVVKLSDTVSKKAKSRKESVKKIA